MDTPAPHPPAEKEHAAPHDAGARHDAPHDASHIARHVRSYIIAGVLLMVLTIITVALSFFDFGDEHVNIGVGLAVAAFKAGVVAWIFMHLNAERPLIHRLLIFTAVFFLALFALIWFAFKDGIPARF